MQPVRHYKAAHDEVFLPVINNPEKCSVKVADFKRELLFSAGVGEERIVEFSCGEWHMF